MRSSIARGALALLMVAAIAGCQNTHWDPVWYNPFHTSPNTVAATNAAPPARAASLDYSSTAAGYRTGTPSNAYAPYNTTTPVGYNGTPNSYSNSSYGGYPSNTQTSSSQVYGNYPSSYNTPGGAYVGPAAPSYTNPAYTGAPANTPYTTVANNPYPPASLATNPGTYPSTTTPPCNGNNCPLPGTTSPGYNTPATQNYNTPTTQNYNTPATQYNTPATQNYSTPATQYNTPATQNYNTPATQNYNPPSYPTTGTPSYSLPPASNGSSALPPPPGSTGSTSSRLGTSLSSGTTVADNRGLVGSSGASSLPATSNTYTPTGNSYYSNPAATPASVPSSTYPLTNTAPPASPDAGNQNFRPGSTNTSSDFSPHSLNSLSSSSVGGNSSGSGVVPAAYNSSNMAY